jgi:hypothetical protein
VLKLFSLLFLLVQVTATDGDRDRNISFFVAQVTATDGDRDREHNIVYFLTGQGIDADQPEQSKFDINRTSGEIYVLKVE